MFEFLCRVKPEKIAADLLHDAKRRLVEHEAAAEHHAALAVMYQARINRLETHPIIGGPGVASGSPLRNPIDSDANYQMAAANPYNNQAKGAL